MVFILNTNSFCNVDVRKKLTINEGRKAIKLIETTLPTVFRISLLLWFQEENSRVFVISA